MNGRPLAFPVKLRPVAVRRHRRVRRRVLASLAMAALAAVFLLRWRVESVAVSPCPGLPQAALVSLRSLSGTPIVLLSLDGVRRLAEVWPGVDSVEARLELPGRLVVTVHPSRVAGSFATGRGWHAVGPDGAPGGRLDGPVAPVLEQFPTRSIRLREGLVIARRVAAETGRQVRVVRRILPGDLEVHLAGRDAGSPGPVLHVRPAGSRAEAWWTARLRRGQTPGRWADLRQDDRAVVGGRG